MTGKHDRNDELPSDRASTVADLAEIGEAAIVSRVLIRNAGGSITLFCFDAGQRLSEHTTPFDAVVHVIDGRLQLMIGGNQVPVRCGEMVRMPAGVPHALEAVEPTRMILTMLRDPEQKG